MAILKHLTSKNSNYGKALEYLVYQHNEYTQKPILDDNGNMQMREELYLDGINCQPLTFAKECEQLNSRYHKNQNRDEIKSHHYIISFDPRDVETGLTGERAQQIGLEFAHKYFDGHQALVCTHTDGHNRSGNIHVHIVINSLRKFDVDRQDYMERNYDSRAGYKHHQTRRYLTAMQEGLMSICEREHLHQVDLLSPSVDKVTDREYRLNQRRSNEHARDDSKPFESQKKYLQDAIRETASYANSPEEFGKDLKQYYGIEFKISRGRFSYLHPERKKYMTGRTLGNDYTDEYLMPILDGNKKAGRTREQMLRKLRQLSVDDSHKAANKTVSESLPEYDPSYDYIADPVAVLHFHTKLRLVVDLQTCAKAQASLAYARKVKMTNLQQMAQTICYVQEHGYTSLEELKDDRRMNDVALGRISDSIKSINEQISMIETSADKSGEQTEQLDYLMESRKRLLSNRSKLKQQIKELQIVHANVNTILFPDSTTGHQKQKAQEISK